MDGWRDAWTDGWTGSLRVISEAGTLFRWAVWMNRWRYRFPIDANCGWRDGQING